MFWFQLAEFRTIEDATSAPLRYNFRPVQALNDRIVYRYDSAATAVTSPSAFVLLFSGAAGVVTKLLAL